MSVERSDIVDFIGFDAAVGCVVLTISDHLPWGTARHLALLQRKFDRYLEFVRGGGLRQTYPDAETTRVRIELKMAYPPDPDGYQMLWRNQKSIRDAGFDLRYELLRGDGG